jgi:transposase InsO family protein
LFKLHKRGSLRGLRLPSEAQIGRYLHQWPRFQRRRAVALTAERPAQPSQVHQCWQLDFKLGIALKNGSQVTLHTVRDPVGEAYIGAVVFVTGQVGQPLGKVTVAEARFTLRRCFAQWQTLPAEVQTDGETTLAAHRQGDFPTVFTLWLAGLGISHTVIRPGRPTDNAEVERCHRTINDYAIVGNEQVDGNCLQTLLDEALTELNFELPSRAEGCAGQPPITAHPELLHPRFLFRPEWELARFDLGRVEAYLATLHWLRTPTSVGQVSVGGHRYMVSKQSAGRPVLIRFDPADRHFVFFDLKDQSQEIRRRPAKGLDLVDLTGLADCSLDLGPQQLPLPLFANQGVSF